MQQTSSITLQNNGRPAPPSRRAFARRRRARAHRVGGRAPRLAPDARARPRHRGYGPVPSLGRGRSVGGRQAARVHPRHRTLATESYEQLERLRDRYRLPIEVYFPRARRGRSALSREGRVLVLRIRRGAEGVLRDSQSGATVARACRRGRMAHGSTSRAGSDAGERRAPRARCRSAQGEPARASLRRRRLEARDRGSTCRCTRSIAAVIRRSAARRARARSRRVSPAAAGGGGGKIPRSPSAASTSAADERALYPINLSLDGRPVLLVGGGAGGAAQGARAGRVRRARACGRADHRARAELARGTALRARLRRRARSRRHPARRRGSDAGGERGSRRPHARAASSCSRSISPSSAPRRAPRCCVAAASRSRSPPAEPRPRWRVSCARRWKRSCPPMPTPRIGSTLLGARARRWKGTSIAHAAPAAAR